MKARRTAAGKAPDAAPMLHPDRPEIPPGPAAGPAPKIVLHGDPQAEDARQEERDRAFDADYEWAGVELLPFSIDRESIFAQLRTAMGAPEIMVAIRDFDAFLADAFRILFICSHPPEKLRLLRRDAIIFQEAVEDWAVKNIRPGQQAAAVSLAINIYADSRVTEHEPAPSGNTEDEHSGN